MQAGTVKADWLFEQYQSLHGGIRSTAATLHRPTSVPSSLYVHSHAQRSRQTPPKSVKAGQFKNEIEFSTLEQGRSKHNTSMVHLDANNIISSLHQTTRINKSNQMPIPAKSGLIHSLAMALRASGAAVGRLAAPLAEGSSEAGL